MFFKMIETGRQYDTEQVLNTLIKDNGSYDDQFLKHDIVFRDASRNIDGVIDFDDGEDRDDFLAFICNNGLIRRKILRRKTMKHWEVEHNDQHLRIEWNESATFNLQTPVGGQWVDYHCFTCYGIDNEQEALEHAMEVLEETE